MSGLVGAGRSEVAQAIFGIDQVDSGEIFFEGKKLEKHDIQKAIRLGIAMVPEDRQHQGLALPLSVETNLLLPSLAEFQCATGLDRSKMRNSSKQLIAKLGIKTATPTSPANSLSGGNQQKIVLGKTLETNPEILIVIEPTRGVDVGAKMDIYKMLEKLCKEGVAIVLVSTDVPEILSISHRVLVVSTGKIRKEFAKGEANQQELLYEASLN